AGLRVLVLDKRPEIASLTTRAATGAFRLQHDNRDEYELVRESLEFYLDFTARTGLEDWDLGIRRQGYLFCSRSEASAARAKTLVEIQRGFGLTDVELVSGDEARRRWPCLAPDVLQ